MQGVGSLFKAAKIRWVVLQELPGRLWEGKENVLEAIGALIAAEPAAFKSPDGLIAALLGARMFHIGNVNLQSHISSRCPRQAA